MMVIGPADVENVDVEEILGVRAEEYLRSKFRDRRQNGHSNKIGNLNWLKHRAVILTYLHNVAYILVHYTWFTVGYN